LTFFNENTLSSKYYNDGTMMKAGDAFLEECPESSQSLGSVDPDDVTVIGGEDDEAEVTAKRNREFTASQVEVNIIFWRNMVLAFVTGTGLVLSVWSHLCLSQWGQLDEAVQQKVSQCRWDRIQLV
jgi:hypothetical protein